MPSTWRWGTVTTSSSGGEALQADSALARVEGVTRACEIVRARRGKSYDPQLADLAADQATAWWSSVESDDPWDAALAAAPRATPLDDAAAHAALLVLADFADLKSPWTSGHSRGVAALAREACGPAAEAAALVHDLGRVAVPNTIWDKPGPLTRDERDRAESHALVTDQLLRRLPFTAALAGAAGAAHERMDGTGYYRRLSGAHLDEAQRVTAAADCYHALTSARPYREAYSPDLAAAELRAMSSAGRCCGWCPSGSPPVRLPSGSRSRRRPPTTTCSTSTRRSASRPGARPPSTPSSTAS